MEDRWLIPFKLRNPEDIDGSVLSQYRKSFVGTAGLHQRVGLRSHRPNPLHLNRQLAILHSSLASFAAPIGWMPADAWHTHMSHTWLCDRLPPVAYPHVWNKMPTSLYLVDSQTCSSHLLKAQPAWLSLQCFVTDTVNKYSYLLTDLILQQPSLMDKRLHCVSTYIKLL